MSHLEVRPRSTKPCNLQRSSQIYCSSSIFSKPVTKQSSRDILGIIFPWSGTDNVTALKHKCNISQVSAESLRLFFNLLFSSSVIDRGNSSRGRRGHSTVIVFNLLAGSHYCRFSRREEPSSSSSLLIGNADIPSG